MTHTRRTILLVASLAAAVLAPVGSGAQAPAPGGATGPTLDDPVRPEDNFEFRPAEGDYLKVDRRTGQVSICRENNDRWRCQIIADDRDAYEDEIARLERENDELARRVEELETALADRDRGSEPWIGPDDEAKVDEFFDFADKAFRRFFGMVEDLRREYDTPDRI